MRNIYLSRKYKSTLLALSSAFLLASCGSTKLPMSFDEFKSMTESDGYVTRSFTSPLPYDKVLENVQAGYDKCFNVKITTTQTGRNSRLVTGDIYNSTRVNSKDQVEFYVQRNLVGATYLFGGKPPEGGYYYFSTVIKKETPVLVKQHQLAALNTVTSFIDLWAKGEKLNTCPNLPNF